MIKLPNGVNINNLIGDLREFSWEAADILKYYYQRIKDDKYKGKLIKFKAINDPVTLADLKVNETIIKRINERYCDVNWNFLSEENNKKEFVTKYIKSDWLWVLDPLDGTKDYIQGTGNYAMHLALNYKNRPYLGVVLIPEKNELWFSNGIQSWCEKKDGTLKKSCLSKGKKIRDLTLVSSKNHSNKNLKLLIEKIRFRKTITMGSIGCKVASIMRGESDIYISLSLPGKSSPKDWDFAAPEAVIRTAGGSITTLDNKKLTYNKENYCQEGIIIATGNKLFHQSICSQIKVVIQEYGLFQ